MKQTTLAVLVLTLLVAPSLLAQGKPPLPVISDPELMPTHQLGGVPVPSTEALKQMHADQYILRARDGKLSQVPVKKSILPRDPEINPQGVQVDLGPDGTVYVRQPTMLCKSKDGGRTWTSQPIQQLKNSSQWKVRRDGTFVTVTVTIGPDNKGPAEVWTSRDEGRSWKKLSEIALDLPFDYRERYCHRGLTRLQDDTLIWAIDVRNFVFEGGKYVSGAAGLFSFRSTNGGTSWDGPTLVNDWGSEGSATLLPSGGILATIRYQRPTLSGDAPDLEKRMRSISKGWPYKHVFLMNSSDGGRTFSMPRQLVSVFGQTFGYPAVQSDGTAVVIHDTRYGPGGPGARAMVSHDEGQTWEDEVYYMDYTTFTGSYSASVVLKDDTILTIAASSQAGNSWEAVRGATDLVALRWKPVKK